MKFNKKMAGKVVLGAAAVGLAAFVGYRFGKSVGIKSVFGDLKMKPLEELAEDLGAKVPEYKPFEDMTMEDAFDVMQEVFDGTRTLTDAQLPVEGGVMLFIE